MKQLWSQDKGDTEDPTFRFIQRRMCTCIALHFMPFVVVCHLRNKSRKPECAWSFNMNWRILVFYPEPEARDKIY